MTKSLADGVQRIAESSSVSAQDLGPAAEEADATEAKILYRTRKEVRQTLRQIALDEQSSMQTLITEAINDLFIKRGRAPIA
ncbi:ribbon-helix-helix domain-containing protein [Pelagibacterium lacus]|uniref:Antitoxin-like ribbon-helix-helix domain-containing protein n=1 Tax=Pelagibacterium lacus TaxID=2282655 RepID=A0A369W1W3_9HYPH|nr:ribbon-helix-helix domain-containing protein [Pelagibacterium lacus]RDE07875.1 hypothetical protein DVH29_14330 [Pelagibacterium lacus]